MAGIGAEAAGGLSALQASIRQRLMDRLTADQLAKKEQQQAFENSLRMRQLDQNDAYRQDTLNETKRLHDQQDADRNINLATSLADQLPPESFLPEQDPAVGLLQQGGRGSLLTEQPEIPAMGQDFEGPMEHATTQDAQRGRVKGYIKGASQKQRDTDADNARQTDTLARQRESDASRERHEREMERIASQNAGSAAQNRDLQGQLQELKIQGERDKLDRATADRTRQESNAKDATQTAYDLTDRLEQHPGFGTAYGNISSRFSGFSQDATDAGSIRDQLVAALALPNLGALKGPMSDKDILFIKQLATRLGNPRISEAEARKALAEAKVFLRSKGAMAKTPGAPPASGGLVSMVAPDGRPLMVPAEKVAELEAAGAKRR